METYTNFISQFEIFDNPPKKEGFHRHHIVPECEQEKMYGQVIDNRQIYVTQAQHLWCHILYDRENGTVTRRRLLSASGLRMKDIHCYEDCLSFNDIINPFKDCHHTEESKKLISIHHINQKGKNNNYYGHCGELHWNYGNHWTDKQKESMSKSHLGRHWFNNGIQETQSYECPEGWFPGRLKKDN